MARQINKLSAKRVSSLQGPGMYGDGAGLFLNIGPNGAKSWIFRYSSPTIKRESKPQLGQQRDMGLGPLHTIGLADARDLAADARKLILQGIDPIEQRRAQQASQQLQEARSIIFDECAEQYIQSHRSGWKNEKHAEQWANTLGTYASPVFGKLPVQSVDTALVARALQPIWQTKTETATRVRGRIERVLDWAKVCGFRQGENPARWKGHLDKLLPAPAKVRRVEHHPALPYAEIGAFMAELRDQESVGALALEFTILTAARTSETIGARPTEFNLIEKVWTVPAVRMKMKREHRVPLSDRAIEIVKELMSRGNKFVFPGLMADQPLSNMAMLELVRRTNEKRAATGEARWIDPLQDKEIVPHGFRSTFRDWAAERTNFPREIAEAALAHVLADDTEAAYQRGDLLEKRRRLMLAWAAFCSKASVGGEVVSLKGAA